MKTELINIGDRYLEVYQNGHGDNTIIFELGCGDSIYDWKHIADALSRENKVILYHRGGYGRSSYNRNDIRTFHSIIGDFFLLLDSLKIKNNLICVAHSFGGACVQKFLMNNKNNIKGLVLVDSSPLHYRELELFKNKMLCIDEKYNTDTQIQNLRNLSLKSSEELTEDGNKGIFQNPDSYHAICTEYDILRNNSITKEESNFKSHIPLKVILSDKNIGIDKLTLNGIPLKEAQLFESKCEELKANQINLSSNAELIIAKNSSHQIHIDKPELVIATIQSLYSLDI